MTKVQAVKIFKEEILPTLNSKDKPLLRMAWNDFVDNLQKDGQITEKQAYSWDQPNFIK